MMRRIPEFLTAFAAAFSCASEATRAGSSLAVLGDEIVGAPTGATASGTFRVSLATTPDQPLVAASSGLGTTPGAIVTIDLAAELAPRLGFAALNLVDGGATFALVADSENGLLLVEDGHLNLVTFVAEFPVGDSCAVGELGFREDLGDPPVFTRVIGLDGESVRPEGEVPHAVSIVPARSFVRGHVNSDDDVDISDPVAILLWLFRGGVDLRCPDAADTNDDGAIGLGDATFLLMHLFLRGPAPSAPFPDPGVDLTTDPLRCSEEPCEPEVPMVCATHGINTPPILKLELIAGPEAHEDGEIVLDVPRGARAVVVIRHELVSAGPRAMKYAVEIDGAPVAFSIQRERFGIPFVVWAEPGDSDDHYTAFDLEVTRALTVGEYCLSIIAQLYDDPITQEPVPPARIAIRLRVLEPVTLARLPFTGIAEIAGFDEWTDRWINAAVALFGVPLARSQCSPCQDAWFYHPEYRRWFAAIEERAPEMAPQILAWHRSIAAFWRDWAEDNCTRPDNQCNPHPPAYVITCAELLEEHSASADDEFARAVEILDRKAPFNFLGKLTPRPKYLMRELANLAMVALVNARIRGDDQAAWRRADLLRDWVIVTLEAYARDASGFFDPRPPGGEDGGGFSTFFVALACAALSEFHAAGRDDPRLIPALEAALARVVRDAYDADQGLFVSQNEDARDLGGLFARPMAYLAQYTGSPEWNDRTLAVITTSFGGFLGHGKQHSQLTHLFHARMWLSMANDVAP